MMDGECRRSRIWPSGAMDQQTLIDQNFPLFAKSRKPSKTPSPAVTTAAAANTTTTKDPNFDIPHLEKSKDTDTDFTNLTTFAELGLAEWAVKTCKELGMRKPRRVQSQCIPKILEGRHVLGIDETGSGKTAAFALPILHRLAEHPFGVCALVVTPTRELAYQLAEQFRALGSCLHVRIAVVVGGMDMLKQATSLMSRPHVVIATPGRIKALLEENPDIPPVFSKTKVMILFSVTEFWVSFLLWFGGNLIVKLINVLIIDSYMQIRILKSFASYWINGVIGSRMYYAWSQVAIWC